MRLRDGAIAGAVVLVALAGGAVVAWSQGRPVGPDPAIEKWGAWPHPVTCRALEFDPVEVFAGSTGAEQETGELGQALRDFLGQPGWEWIPRRDWRLAAQDGSFAEFVQGRLSSERAMSWLAFRNEGERWKWVGSGGCTPRTVRDGLPAADWNLDHESPAPQPSAQAITVRVEERACSGGSQPYPRLQRPEIRYTRRAVFISFWVTPRRGPQFCPGVLPRPYELRLPKRLGDRQLFDAGTYPPRPLNPE